MDSLEDVEKWVREHDGEGAAVSDLRKSLKIGIFSGKSAQFARAWLDEHDHGDSRRIEAEKLELARRSTGAAETSASAATSSARHAADSAKWAKWAIVVALASLIVSAWPYIKSIAG